jgi:hypothetical protein
MCQNHYPVFVGLVETEEPKACAIGLDLVEILPYLTELVFIPRWAMVGDALQCREEPHIVAMVVVLALIHERNGIAATAASQSADGVALTFQDGLE